MTQLSEKENFRLLLSGEMPEFIPSYNMFLWRFYPTFNRTGFKPDGSGFDVFGVEYTTAAEADGAAIPVPGKHILDDITRWRDVIKTPDLSGVDWDKVVAADVDHRDPANNPLLLVSNNGYFQHIMKFMGFEEGLCAMYEEPEECRAMLEYLCDYYLEIEWQYTKRGAFLGVNLTDDTATAINPFISMDLYREILKPVYRRHCEQALNSGLFVTLHNCGRCEDQIEDWFDLGISGWDPAQPVNDLKGIKAQYGRKLAIIGGWDSTGPAVWPDSTEEQLRAELERYVDALAPGGGFCFAASVMGGSFDERQKKKYGVIREFYETRVRNYYDTH